MTALHLAADRDQAAVAALLIEAGVDRDVRNVQGSTPLLWAVGEGATAVAGLLLDHGADPTIENRHGYSAAGMAEYVEDEALANRLREAAAGGDD